MASSVETKGTLSQWIPDQIRDDVRDVIEDILSKEH